MLTWLKGAAAATLLGLAACNGTAPVVTPPGPGPTPPPVVVGPTESPQVQEACAAAQWALPVLQALGVIPASLKQEVAILQSALPDCAAGNASAAIVDAVNSIMAYLGARGRHPPPGIPARIVPARYR